MYYVFNVSIKTLFYSENSISVPQNWSINTYNGIYRVVKFEIFNNIWNKFGIFLNIYLFFSEIKLLNLYFTLNWPIKILK